LINRLIVCLVYELTLSKFITIHIYQKHTSLSAHEPQSLSTYILTARYHGCETSSLVSLMLIIVFIIREDDFFTLLGLFFAPVVSALGAHEDQVHAVLSRVHKGHSLVVTTPPAVHVLATGQCRVLDALLVNLKEELGALAGGSTCLSSLAPGGSLLLT
jgi:hypothetical protein